MNLRNILITGGAGYVGAVLVPLLLHKGYRVKVIDLYIYGRNVIAPKGPNLIEIKGDLRDQNLLRKELRDMDAVIHLACISNDPSFELDKKLGRDINYLASQKLIDLSQKMGIKRFIYASTSSVYGIKKEAEVTEDLPLEPLTDYSKYKMLTEKYLLAKQTKDFSVLVIRPATICGYSPRLRLDLTVNMLTLQALVNRKITVFGGKQKRPNIHIKDMTDLYTRTLTYPDEKIAGKIYNAGQKNYTLWQIAEMVKKVLADPTIKIITVATDDLRSYHISSDKIKKELGFCPKYTVEEAIFDLQKAYLAGKIPKAFSDVRYYNIKTMLRYKNLIS